jgi:Sensors of blue-light using FAD
MTSLLHIIYCSAASADFEEVQIPSILEHSRANNGIRNITGMLLYIQRSFFQVLEGDAATVNAAYEKIKLDPRHHRVTGIIAEPIVRRSFGQWSMGFSTLRASRAGNLLGENDFFASASCLENMTEGRAKKLLSAFQDGRWQADATGTHRAPVRSAR